MDSFLDEIICMAIQMLRGRSTQLCSLPIMWVREVLPIGSFNLFLRKEGLIGKW